MAQALDPMAALAVAAELVRNDVGASAEAGQIMAPAAPSAPVVNGGFKDRKPRGRGRQVHSFVLIFEFCISPAHFSRGLEGVAEEERNVNWSRWLRHLRINRKTEPLPHGRFVAFVGAMMMEDL